MRNILLSIVILIIAASALVGCDRTTKPYADATEKGTNAQYDHKFDRNVSTGK